MRRILCFGDSNTYGFSPVDGQRYGDDINWPGVLNSLLGEKFEVINEGKNGRTIAFDDPYIEGCNGMNDIEKCLADNEPLDMIAIMLGTNDLKVYFDAIPQDIEKNLLEMCKVIRDKSDAKLVIMSPTLLGDQIEFSPLHLEFGRMQVDYSFELAPSFQRVAKEVDAEFIDLAMIAMSSDVDCLHLMPEEHAKIAQAMKDIVLEVFREELEREAKEEEEAAKAAELKRIQEEEEAKKQAEEEAARQAEEEAKRQAEEEAARQAEEEAKRQAEEEAARQAEEEAKRQAEEEARQAEEEAAREEEDAEEKAARLKVEAILKAAEEEVAREDALATESVLDEVEDAEEEVVATDLLDAKEETEVLQTSEFVNPLAESEAVTIESGSDVEKPAVAVTVETTTGAMAEKDKMLAGKLYTCDDVLRKDKENARKITDSYNQTTFSENFKKTELLSQLFKKVGAGTCIETPFRCEYGSNISIGDNFRASFDCVMLDAGNITIGDNVIFGPKVNVYTSSYPIYVDVRNQGFECAKEVAIGDNVWIGGNVTINPGVHIGSNVVIGSGSVVTGDIPDGVVAAGNPCRIIRRISDTDKQYWEEQKAK